MGRLVEGIWHDDQTLKKSTDGSFVRADAGFRNWITPDGSPGPSGDGGFRAEHGRYHLYISLACPWAHRTLLLRKLKGLEDSVSLSVVHFLAESDGWTFHDGPGVVADEIHGSEFMREVYTHANPTFSGRVTVPVLWDKKQKTIVSNESSEILRMFNSAFDGLGATPGDYYPEKLRPEIDEVNERIYHTLNNGVYRCGFATAQTAYEEAFDALFATMDWLEERLGTERYLVGNEITEADWRLFTTLVRFDAVYVGHFKVNRQRLVDYPNLWAYTRELYQVPGVAETVDMLHIKEHYYRSHESVNPTRIVPKGPDLDFLAPHGRVA